MQHPGSSLQLLGDVGGTNARLALAAAGVILPDSLQRFSGDLFGSFEDVLAAYLEAMSAPQPEGVCIAVAGPVSAGEAMLTNRNWTFSEAGLMRSTGARRVILINDLTALGHATARITPRIVRAAPANRARNGQSLVVGAGTGFNVCAIAARADGSRMCLEAEVGHTALPDSIAATLRACLGDAATGFGSVEELLAGRGLSRLHALLARTPAIPAEAVVSAASSGDPSALATCALFADLFGAQLRELSLQFMPREGIWLAGSVARSLLPQVERIVTAMLAEPVMRHIPEAMPLLLIEDDMAALQGCLAAITQ